jgi:hypothetical protein
MAIGGDRKAVCRFSATSTPKRIGSMPKCSSIGRKMGTKMMMISVHSSGQPSTKMMACDSSRKVTAFRFRPSTNSLISTLPPRYAKIDAKVAEPTNSQHTMAEVRAVRKTDSRNPCQVKER